MYLIIQLRWLHDGLLFLKLNICMDNGQLITIYLDGKVNILDLDDDKGTMTRNR
jgi:hypothetical protein